MLMIFALDRASGLPVHDSKFIKNPKYQGSLALSFLSLNGSNCLNSRDQIKWLFAFNYLLLAQVKAKILSYMKLLRKSKIILPLYSGPRQAVPMPLISIISA